MKRRDLFGRLATIAAAVALAPVAKAEADRSIEELQEISRDLQNAYREGYERREFVEAMRAESRTMRVMRQ